jgi:hypothetical protein
VRDDGKGPAARDFLRDPGLAHGMDDLKALNGRDFIN